MSVFGDLFAIEVRNVGSAEWAVASECSGMLDAATASVVVRELNRLGGGFVYRAVLVAYV